MPLLKDLSSVVEVGAFQTTNFKNTLLFKLGFSLEQLLPLLGLTQNDFNRGNHNKYLELDANVSDKMQNMVRPFTTNAYVSGAIVPSLVKGTGYTQDSPTSKVPQTKPPNQHRCQTLVGWAKTRRRRTWSRTC